MANAQVFSGWLSQALSEWPQSLDLKICYMQSDGQRYVVEGLGQLADDIGDTFIGREDELIFRNLHWAINVAIHGLAKYTTRICLADLRGEPVQDIFNAKLRSCIDDLKKEGEEIPALLCEYIINNTSAP
ncbi:hypothetical protein [Oryzomicrobium sp.]|uniref:hypothetical protein n=1 Tax=Oryzomicrobium sp. TaxID=1911578 RepID=UPI002FE33A91